MGSITKLEPPDDTPEDDYLFNTSFSPCKTHFNSSVPHHKNSETSPVLQSRQSSFFHIKQETDSTASDEPYGLNKFDCNSFDTIATGISVRNFRTDHETPKPLHSQENGLIESGFSCQFCQEKVATLNLLEKHISINHFKTLQEQCWMRCQDVICGICEIKFAMCSYCGKDYVSERSIKKHIQGHESKALFVCTHCCLTLPREDHETHLFSHNEVPALCKSCFKLSERSLPCSDKKYLFNDEGQDALREIGRKKLVVVLERMKDHKKVTESKKVSCNSQSSMKFKLESHWCEECATPFTSPKSLEKHLLESHSESFCEGVTNKRSELDTNKTQREILETDSPSDSGIEIAESGETAVIEKDHSELICDICDKTFTKSQTLKEHIAIHMEYTNSREEWLCVKDNQDDINGLCREGKQKGERIKVKIDDAYFDPDFGVDNCGDSNDRSTTVQHKIDDTVTGPNCTIAQGKIAKNSWQEPSIPKQLPYDEIYVEFCDDVSMCQTKFTLKTNSFSNCEICGEELDFQNLASHMQTHMNGTDKTDNVKKKITDVDVQLRSVQCSCEICGDDCKDPVDLVRHMKEHTGENSEEDDDVIVSKEQRDKGEIFPCMICDQEFMEIKSFRNHMQAHIHEKPLGREICEETLDSNSNIRQHCESRNVQDAVVGPVIESQYFCKLCNHQFSNQDDYTKHSKLSCQEKPFRCEYCGVRFLTNGEVQKHILRHSDSPEIPMRHSEKCQSCGKLFTIMEMFKNHKKICKQNISEVKKTTSKKGKVFSRNFSCTKCDKTFAYEPRLRQHIEAVHGVKSFKFNRKFICKKCGKSFAYEACFQNHVRLCKEVLTSGLKLHCEECGKSFHSQVKLFDHLQRFHDPKSLESTSKFNCKKCSRKFTYERAYKNHMNKVHGAKFASLESKFACNKGGKSYSRRSRSQKRGKVDAQTN